jgi:hypothetical protein
LVDQDDEFLDGPLNYENDIEPIFEIDTDADDFYDVLLIIEAYILPDLFNDGADSEEHIYDTTLVQGPPPTAFNQTLLPDIYIDVDRPYGVEFIGFNRPSIRRYRRDAIFDVTRSGKAVFGEDHDASAIFNVSSAVSATFDDGKKIAQAIFNTKAAASALLDEEA